MAHITNEKRIEKAIEKQRVMLETIQNQGFNIVYCGDCGKVFIHKMVEGELTCPYCLTEMDQCDCTDLAY